MKLITYVAMQVHRAEVMRNPNGKVYTDDSVNAAKRLIELCGDDPNSQVNVDLR